MPTLEHDGIIELFRDNLELAPQLIARFYQTALPMHEKVRIADSLLAELTSVEFRADLVIELLDASGCCVAAIVLESQREIKPRKRFTWPAYVSVCRAERECDTALLIVAVDAAVAKWAAETIEFGFGSSQVRPFVLGPKVLPEIIDKQEAVRDKELAVLSAMAHGNGPHGREVLLATFAALEHLDTEHAAVYFHIIWKTLREPMKKALEAMAMEHQVKPEELYPPFLQTLMNKHFIDGEVKGEIKTLRDAVLRLARRQGLAFSTEQEASVRSCEDRALLNRWLDNVLDAKTSDDVFR